ncbi:MAG: acetyl-CoA C-acyltransferase [Actinomycetia bacterium]|nr:acetyl-CoA C-acyltransferase [Actinomycetes bacterium]
MREVVVTDFVRTPRGKASPRGGLAHLSATDLVVHLMRALPGRTGLDPALVEDVVLGCASQVGEQGANTARTAALLVGWGSSVGGSMINRFCASGIDAVTSTAARLRSGDLDVAVAGGVESVSRVPIFSDGGPLWTDPNTIRDVGSVHMGIAADLCATIAGHTRSELEEYAVETQSKAGAAWERGAFGRSVIPVTGPDGQPGLATDEHVRPETTLESLAALEPAFAALGESGQDAIALAANPVVDRIEHLHTVGTSPAMADAAALLVVATREGAAAAGLRPRARVLTAATAAVDPVIMLTAGQMAVETVLRRAGLQPDEIDVFEFAEAFSSLCLTFRDDLGLGPAQLNPNGGTMAMGHAFGATGSILIGQCIEELEVRGGRYGIAAVSGAAGVGSAVLVERLDG